MSAGQARGEWRPETVTPAATGTAGLRGTRDHCSRDRGDPGTTAAGTVGPRKSRGPLQLGPRGFGNHCSWDRGTSEEPGTTAAQLFYP